MARMIEHEHQPYYGGFAAMDTGNVRVRVTENLDGSDEQIVRIVEVQRKSMNPPDFTTTLVSKAAREKASVKIISWKGGDGKEVNTLGSNRKYLDAPEDLRKDVLDYVGERMLDLYAELKTDYDFSPIVPVCNAITAAEPSLKLISKEPPDASRRKFSPFFTKMNHDKRPKRDRWFVPNTVNLKDAEACVVCTTTPLDAEVISIITPLKDKFYCELAYTKRQKNVIRGRRIIPHTTWETEASKVMKSPSAIVEEIISTHKTVYDKDAKRQLEKLSIKEKAQNILQDLEMPGEVVDSGNIEAKVYFNAESEVAYNKLHMKSWVRVRKNEEGYEILANNLPPLSLEDLKRVMRVFDERVTDHVCDVKLEGV